MKLCLHRKGHLWANAKPLTDEQQKLVTDNIALAYHYCKKRPILGLDPDENESEALFCLTRAAGNYNPALGFRFTTFAWSVWVNHRKHAHRESKMKTKGYQLAQTCYHGDNLKMFDPADSQLGPDEIAEKNDERKENLKCLDILDPRAKTILEKRMEGLSLSQIGNQMGITRERVRQIEKSAVYRIQYYFDTGATGSAIDKNQMEKKQNCERVKTYHRQIAAIRAMRRRHPSYDCEKIAELIGCSLKLARKYGQRKNKPAGAA